MIRPTTRNADTKTKKSTKPKKLKALSLRPDDALQFGLLSDVDFNGITDAYWAPWNMNGKLERDGEPFHMLGFFVAYDMGDDEPYLETYTAGYLGAYVPSEDGEEPAGGDFDDYLALDSGEETEPSDEMRGYFKIPCEREGKTARPANQQGTGEHFFFSALEKCAKAVGREIEWDDEDGNPRPINEVLAEFSGHLDRVKIRESDKNGVLVPVEIDAEEGKGKKKIGSKSGASAKKSKRAVVEDEEDEDETEDESEEEDIKPVKKTTNKKTGNKLPDDAHEQIEAAIREILGENDGTMKQKDIAAEIGDKFSTRAMISEAVSCCGDADFLEALDGVTWDPKKRVLALEEEE